MMLVINTLKMMQVALPSETIYILALLSHGFSQCPNRRKYMDEFLTARTNGCGGRECY